MTPFAPPLDAAAIRAMYPERDGKPMSDNMTQGRWIHLLFGNLCALVADREDAFVASDNLWYPLEKRDDERQAPDVYVVFGRPKGDRGSYVQCLEDDVPITVVFEILSPGNSKEEMAKKFLFYDHYGVEEYYIYDPNRNKLSIYTRGLATLRLHRDIAKFVSPRLGIRFEMTKPEMTVYGPDGEPFRPHEEDRRMAREAKKEADENEKLAEDNAKRADENAKRAQHAERVAELARKILRNKATAEEVAEFERLEEEAARGAGPTKEN